MTINDTERPEPGQNNGPRFATPSEPTELDRISECITSNICSSADALSASASAILSAVGEAPRAP
jgi:hypothetical protein